VIEVVIRGEESFEVPVSISKWQRIISKQQQRLDEKISYVDDFMDLKIKLPETYMAMCQPFSMG